MLQLVFCRGVYSIIDASRFTTVLNFSTLQSGLCAFYNFEGNTRNTANLGTLDLSGTNFSYMPGKVGLSATSYRGGGGGGTGDGITQSEVDLWTRAAQSDYTVSFWVNIDSYNPPGGGSVMFGSWAGYGTEMTISIGVDSATGRLFWNNRRKMPHYSTASLNLSTWYHIATVFNNTLSSGSVYINGNLDSSFPFTASTFQAGSPTTAGKGYGVGGSKYFISSPTLCEYGFAGKIDSLGIWTRALSASEILALNNYGNGVQWPFTYPAQYLIVAGGGGGGTAHGGGGGAGGLITGSTTLSPETTYTIIVGAGGAGGIAVPGTNNKGSSGGNSSFSIASTTGGGGGGAYQGNTATQKDGLSGGSGGGGGGSPASGTGGDGIAGQGFAGGSSSTNGTAGSGGGGGGAGSVGTTPTTIAGVGSNGNGGNGVASSITGSAVTYAGGGGGGSWVGNGGISGTGGTGGGGAGGATSNARGTDGTANTGGGGGGGSDFTPGGGNGGSGVVILSIPTSNYSGITTGSPTVIVNGSNTVLVYNSSGTYKA